MRKRLLRLLRARGEEVEEFTDLFRINNLKEMTMSEEEERELSKHLEEFGEPPPLNIARRKGKIPYGKLDPELEISEQMGVAHKAGDILDSQDIMDALRTMSWGMIRDCLDYAEEEVNFLLSHRKVAKQMGFSKRDLEILEKISDELEDYT